jgi:hypothetical protein
MADERSKSPIQRAIEDRHYEYWRRALGPIGGRRAAGSRDMSETDGGTSVEANEPHSSGVVGTLLKHFSWDNVFVLLVGDGIGLSLCIAAGDAALRKDWGPMFAGFGIGLPLMALASSFPFWKRRVARWVRDGAVHVATGGAAFIVLAACIYVLGPFLLPRPPSAAEIAATVVRALPQSGAIGVGAIGQMPIGGNPATSLLEQASIAWDGHGPIIFHARVDHPIEKVPVYLDWGQTGGYGQSILNSGFYSNPRIEIAFIDREAVGQLLSVTVGTPTTEPNVNREMLQWGESHYNNPKVDFLYVGYVARVVIIEKDGKEEHYPFLIVPRANPGSTATLPPAIIGTGVFEGSYPMNAVTMATPIAPAQVRWHRSQLTETDARSRASAACYRTN